MERASKDESWFGGEKKKNKNQKKSTDSSGETPADFRTAAERKAGNGDRGEGFCAQILAIHVSWNIIY
jgi:hypothetical protein